MLFDDEDWDELLDSLFSFAVDLVPELIKSGAIKSNAEKLTVYSLYK